MSKILVRVVMWLVGVLACAAFVFTALRVRDYGKVEVEPEIGVLYSSDSGEILNVPASDTIIETNIRYADGEECMLDIAYLDEGKKKPLMLLVHGDAYMTGSRTDVNALMYTYSNKGYVVATVDYGLLPSISIIEQQRSIMAAAEYLAINSEKYGIDSGRMVIVGVSSGAQLATRIVEEVSSEPDKYIYHISGLVVVAGMTDFTTFDKDGTDRSFRDFLEHPEWISYGGDSIILPGNPDDGSSGTTISQDLLARTVNPLEEIGKIDPVFNMNSDLPPVIIFHGAEDDVVPLSVARSFYDALQRARVTSSMVIVPQMGHNTDYGKLVIYLDRFLANYV